MVRHTTRRLNKENRSRCSPNLYAENNESHEGLLCELVWKFQVTHFSGICYFNGNSFSNLLCAIRLSFMPQSRFFDSNRWIRSTVRLPLWLALITQLDHTINWSSLILLYNA